MASLEQETGRALDSLDRVENRNGWPARSPSRTRAARSCWASSRRTSPRPLPCGRGTRRSCSRSLKDSAGMDPEGLLQRAEGPSSRILLDVRRVHQVLHLVQDLRAAGRTTGLLGEVHRRLVDATWLEREDLDESSAQLRRREGTLRVAKQSA